MSIKKTLAMLAMGIALLVSATNSFAQTRTFSYQGLVCDAAKGSLTGVHQLTVKLYDSPVEGRVIHSESFTTSFDNGIFNVIVGSTQPIGASVSFEKQYWIAVSIDGGAELSPRTTIVSTPTAIHAEAASSLLAGATGAVRSMNGRSGDLFLKGGEGTTVRTEGDNIIITATPNIQVNPQATTVNSIKGTANQVLANGNAGTNESGAVTLTLPQSIGTNSNVTFGKVTAPLVGTNTGNGLGLDVDHGARIKGGTEIQNGLTISSGSFTDGGNMDVNGNANIYGVTKLHLGPQTGRLMSSDVSSYGNGNGNTAPVGYGPIWNGTCIVADLCGNASTATNATNFTGNLSGDVTGTMSATYLSKIQGNSVLASGVHNPTNGQALTWNSTDNAWEPAMVSGGSVVTNNTLIPDGTPSNPLGINLANPNTWTGIQTFPNGSITNAELANASLNVNTGTGLSGGGNVALGGALTLDANIQHDGSLSGIGTTADPLMINTGNANNWTATQTFPAGSITNDELSSANYTVTAGDGLLGGGTAALGSAGVTLSVDAQTDASLTGNGTTASPLSVNMDNENTWNQTQYFPDNSIPNNTLANSSINVSYSIGLSGDASVALGGTLNLNNDGVLSITGTANQVIASASTGDVTLSLPQNIHSGASPSFVNVNLSGIPNSSTYDNVVVYNGGLLQTRTTASILEALTASNGLTRTGDDFQLGGTLSHGTNINQNGFDLTTSGTGNVGIGVPTPGSKLDVNGNIHASGTLSSGSTITINGAAMPRTINSDNNMNIATTAGDIKINPSGNVGIGTAGAPTQKLDVTGNVQFSGALMPNSLAGSNGQILRSNGAAVAPTWQNTMVGTGLSGDGISTTLDANIQHDATLSGVGTTANKLVINLGNANTWTGIQTFPNGSITNIELQNPSLNVNTGSGLSGGGNVALGGTLTLDANIQHDATLSGIGTTANKLKIDLANPNTWTGVQSFPAASIPNATLVNSSVTINTVSGLSGGGNVALGSTLNLNADIQHDATLSGIGTASNKLVINLGNTNTWTGIQTFPNGSITNIELQNPSLNVNTGSGLSGGGNVALGGALTLDANIQHDATLAGIGTTANKLKIDLTNANTWTGVQSFPAASIPNATLVNSSITINNGPGISGGALVSLGGSLTINNTGVLTVSGSGLVTSTGGQNPTIGLTTGTNGQVLTSNGVASSWNALTTDATMIGNGTTTSFGINLNNANTWVGIQTFPNGSITNAELQNASLNVNTGTGLSGGGNVALGGTLTLDANIQHDASLSGIGTTGNQLTINTGNANNWTATQTFPAGSITIGELEAGATFTVNAGTGLSGGGTSILGGSVTLNNTGVLSITGTANQVIASASTGNVTLSLPQNIDNGASPQFNNVNLTGIPGSSSYTDVVVSNGGLLQTRTVTDLLSTLTASNGLTRVGNDIRLGGTLSGSTDIASAGFNLNLTGSGKVGIGNNTPAEALDVTGNIHASGTLSSGSTIVIDGAAATRTITSDQAMSINTTAGNLTLNPTGVVQINGAGKFQFNEGSQASGWFLQCDANGVATWSPVSSAAGAAWTLGGNTFGAAPSTNLLGTLSNTDIKFITNGSANTRMTIKGNGDIAVTGRNLDIDGIHYAWPTAQAAANDYVLTNDGSGNLSWTNRIVNTTIFSYGEIAANANGINIPSDKTVVRITGTVNANFNYTLPSGTNGQILFIYNNSNKTANQTGGVGNTNINNGTMIQFIYANGWIHVTG
jgi:hypothetical protein